MPANARPPARSIADFQLRRVADSFDFLHFDYLQPFIGTTAVRDWKFFTIVAKARKLGEELLNYATLVPLATYQVLNAQLEDPNGQRFTEMRLHEMIRSTWALQSGTEIRRLGIHQIENSAARTAIQNEFEDAVKRGADPAGRTVTVSGAGVLSPYWQDNPFIRCAVKVAGDRTRVVAHLIKEGTGSSSKMHMVCELDAGVGRALNSDASSKESLQTEARRVAADDGD